jgi:S-DNA-T family DNA segregation ATPase FtsK/SpoIIIE
LHIERTQQNLNHEKGLKRILASKAISEKNSGRKTAKQDVDSSERSASEVSGILLIAGGILTAAYLFFSATGYLGEVLGHALFGMIGFIAYALPVILIVVGILYVRGSATGRLAGSGWYLLLGLFALVTLFQTIRDMPYEGVDYMKYLSDAYNAGQVARVGGGFLGAVLSYPLLLLGGKTLAYGLSIPLTLICTIALTGFSLNQTFRQMRSGVSGVVERRHETQAEKSSKMFTLTLEGEANPPSTGKKKGLPSPEDIFEVPAGNPKQKRFPKDELIEVPSSKPKQKRLTQEEPVIGSYDQSSKSKKAIPVPKAVVEPVAFGEQKGEFKTKTGERVKPAQPEVVKPDIWKDIDFEPGDDVPFNTKVKPPVDMPKPVSYLPDTTPLFGAQPAKPAKPSSGSSAGGPARQPGAKTPPTTTKPKTQPEVVEKYVPPSIELLNKPGVAKEEDTDLPEEKARILIQTLQSFRISAQVTHIAVGPALTRIEIQPAAGTRISRITALQNDITMALAAPRLRMEAPIPGKNAIGIEIPNKSSAFVVLRDILESREFRGSESPITMAFGREASGKIIVADLAKMPHLLIAGATGSGKSVCINDIIVGMVYKSSPEDVRFILVDPKRVEMIMYSSLPHLLMPVVTEAKKAAGALRWAVNEMTRRYKIFADLGARNLEKYNEKVKGTGEHLPRIVVIIDELADLMGVAPDDVEDSIQRIAQLGRAAGIHLILATQRPDSNVITGLIKANINSRAAFAVNSVTNSRIILDMGGAEKLLGQGDMLFHPDGSAKPTRLQCSYISDEEVERVMLFFKEHAHPVFSEQILSDINTFEKGGAAGGAHGEGKQSDDLLGDAVRTVFEHGQASTSVLQRKLRVGYNRASRLIDIMERNHYIGGFNGSKARDVLITRQEIEKLFGSETPLVDPPEEREPNPMSAFYSDRD